METSSISALPGVSSLLSSSWVTFKKSLLHIFILYLITCAISFALVVIFIMIIVFTGIGAGITNVWQNPIAALPLLAIGAGFFVFLLVGFILIGAFIQVGLILIIDSEGKISIDEILKKSLKLIIPLSITGFLSGVITLGGFFLFVIPGIVFAYLLLFTQYEVILHNRRGISALRRSVTIIKGHFWETLMRLAVIVGIEISLTFLPLLFVKDEAFASTLNVVLIFARILFGWYAATYMILLYKAAEKATTEGKEAKMTVIVLLSVLGWIASIVFLTTMFRFLNSQFQDSMRKSKMPNYKYYNNKRYPPAPTGAYNNYYPTITPRYQ